MKKNLRVFVYFMVLVIAAGGFYLWSLGHGGEDVLKGIDPESYDIEATCIGIEDNNLICNAGNDMFLFLDGSRIYLRNYDVEIKENGDEEIQVSYKRFSLEELKSEIEEKESVPVYLWLTENGKVKTIMAGRESFENNNASLANLEGLDPNSYTATNVILSMDKGHMTLAPTGYTGESEEKFEGLISRYRFAKDVKFYKGTVTVTVAEDGERKRNLQYSKDSYSAVRKRLGQDLSAHIWINDDGNICAVLTHEEHVVLE